MNAVEMHGIVKQYPLVRALDNVNFEVEKGEIHSILGENGAGKSTLMNVLYGMTTCDEGEILIDGKKVSIKHPSQAIALGIGMVHQHFMLTPVMTVTENIIVGSEPVKGPFVDYKTASKNVAEMIEEYLEDKSIYWNDDIEIVETFTLKTIKKFEEKRGSAQPLLPMFKDEDDKDFAIRLFRQSLLKGKEYRERIDKHIRNWESERVASMDLIIMQVALAEILSFPSIPISVTLNEYIDAAKYYSTPKSGNFINGILDSIVGELKKEKLLLKD